MGTFHISIWARPLWKAGSLQEHFKYNPLKQIPREAPQKGGERPVQHILKDGREKEWKNPSILKM